VDIIGKLFFLLRTIFPIFIGAYLIEGCCDLAMSFFFIFHQGLSTLFPSVHIFGNFRKFFEILGNLIYFLWALTGLKRLKFLGCTRIFSSRQPLDFSFIGSMSTVTYKKFDFL